MTEDEENFRISPGDEKLAPFPTKDEDNSFTLGAFYRGKLIAVVSFERDSNAKEKLRHKGTLFRMLIEKDFRSQGLGKRMIKEVLKKHEPCQIWNKLI